MVFILLSLLQLVGTAFYYYYSVVVKEIDPSAWIISHFCPVTERSRVFMGICLCSTCDVLSSRAASPNASRISSRLFESCSLRLCRCPCGVFSYLCLLALLFQVVKWGLNKDYESTWHCFGKGRNITHYSGFPEILKQILQNQIQNRDVDAGDGAVGFFLADHAGRRLAFIYIRVCVFCFNTLHSLYGGYL